MSNTSSPALLMAGIPQLNSALYHRIRFLVGDPVAYVQTSHRRWRIEVDPDSPRYRDGPGPPLRPGRRSGLPRATSLRPSGLSGDRETATAQAAAECLRRAGVTRVVADRTLPLIFADLVPRGGHRRPVRHEHRRRRPPPQGSRGTRARPPIAAGHRADHRADLPPDRPGRGRTRRRACSTKAAR